MMTHRARSLKAVLCILAAAIVFFLPSLSRSARAEEPVAITVPGITVTVKDGSTGDPAAGYIMRQMTGVGAPPTKGASGFSKLEGNDARLYTALKPLIAEVAAGERGSTVFEIPVTEIYEKIYYTFEELGAVDGDAAQAAFQDRIAFDIGKVNSALLVDCPYELYWYDKTSGIGSQGYSYSMTSTAVFFPENNTIPIYLYVSAEYSVSGSSGTFDMDTSWGTSVQAAASTARGIVTANAGLGDIAKLTAYKDAICGRVDYNFDALAAGTLYGNPWQLIWVFDNDPTTKVVCEGYSKAFQFLCDESAFSGSTSSIIVSGTMQGGTGAGGHMWNVVTLDNGRKYLADVTNSDAGSVGQDGGLFLDGYTNKEALSDGRVAYTYEIGSQSITYWYDSKIIDLYGPDDLSLPEIIDQGTLDGGIAWALDDNGLLTLEGTGEAAVASADAQPWYSYRSGITSVHVSEGITSLGDHLFHGLNALESVDLPSGLESIRAYTFDNCAALQAVDLPAGLTSIGNYAFDGCHALMSVVIPDTVTSLGKDVFSNCHALSSAVVGSGVTDLPEGAFNNCESLADVTFRGELMSIGPWAFSNGDSNGGQIWAMSSFTVPDTVMSIGAYAFNLQTGLTEMVLPASVEEIGAYAFKSCRGLTSVTVLDRDAEFGEGAFDQCTGMTLRGYACSTAADYAAANDITYQAIPGGDHVMTAHPKLEATCTEEGTEAYWECTVCGKLFSDENGTTQIDEPVAIAAGHTLTAHAKKEVTCTEDGMEAYWECTVCGCIFADGDGLAELDALPVIYTDGHDLTENPKVEATCTENGMEAYWECGVCGKLFADADALMEIDAPVTIPGGHHLTTHEKQDATCTSDGTEAYWECDACGKLFADADAFIEIDEPEVIPGGHELLEYWQVAATCTKAGNTAYWACEACGKYFSDAEGTDEIEENSWVISALGHNLTGTAAKDATSTEAGNTAYWTCEACGKYFSDAQGDTEIEEGSWVIPPLGAPVLTVSDVGSSYDYNDVVELRADVTCPSASDEELLDRYPDARITASLITADGDTVSGFIVQSVSGLEASFRFPLGDDSMGPGYYKIRVETNVEGLAADSASFYYTAEKNDLPDPADCRVKLTLNTTIFGLNERFRLTARVTNTAGEPVQGIRVGFQVLDLNGDITDFYTGYSYLYNTTNGEGTCSITSTLSEEEIFPAGHYVARVFILDGDSSDSLPFEFVRADHSTHQYVKVEGTAPTCTDAGTETYWKCSVCCLLFSAQNENAQISAPATIPARGHTPVVDPAVAATVDSTGLTEGSHCSVCGAILKAQQVIPKIDEPAIAVIDAATFPDKAFLAWVSANADTNRDGKLTKTEIASVKSADLSAVRTVEKLDGIELFTALEALDVSDNKLTELDVSGLTELRTLKADNNKLTCLDLSGNTKLTALSCAGSAYTVKVKAGVIDLSAFKGFDVSRASAFGTGKVSGTTLTVLEPGDVTYTYDCGRNFKAVFTLKVTADPVDVTKVTTSKVKYAYTGKEIEPVLTVTATVDGREITLDEKQYEAEFKDNVKAGKATVKVTGTGFFKGSVETAFEITKVKLASATLKYTKTTYTGKALKPTATVKAKVGGKTVTLKSGTDYSLTYKNNTDAGKATVTVKGKGNFTGTLTKTFTITGAPITEAKVKNASLPYNGKAKTPILIVKAKVGTRTVTLKKSTDYTATYANNTNVGTATVTVKGRGNYSGTVKCTFKINPLKLSTGKAALSDTALKYTGKALKPKVTVTVKVGTKTVTLTQGTDFTVKYLNNKKPGTATVTITGKGNFTGTVKLTFDIMKK